MFMSGSKNEYTASETHEDGYNKFTTWKLIFTTDSQLGSVDSNPDTSARSCSSNSPLSTCRKSTKNFRYNQTKGQDRRHQKFRLNDPHHTLPLMIHVGNPSIPTSAHAFSILIPFLYPLGKHSTQFNSLAASSPNIYVGVKKSSYQDDCFQG